MARVASRAAGSVGRRIAAARIAAGATLQDLAYHAHVDLASLSQYENGKAMPNVGTLVRLATTLGLDPGSLIADLEWADFPQDPGRDAPQPLPRGRRAS